MVRTLPLLALTMACSGEPDVQPLPDNELLTRLSLDLRGVRPSVSEYERLRADPTQLDALTEEYLNDPRFPGRVMDLWSEVYLTRSEGYAVAPDDFGVDPAAFYQSIGQEPLQLLGHVAANDLPYTEVVTAGYTLANETTADLWSLDYPDGATGWQVAHYTDGRPHAGVLTANGMWWRYGSTDSNANRKRANEVSRILLCNDYLVRPIDFDRNVNLLDQDAVEDALRTNPGCVNCHVSLDPLASYFWGFYYVDPASIADTRDYHPERETMWRSRAGVAPGFYGEPGYTLHDLGHQIAADNRFVECAVEQSWELLLRRDADLIDADTLTRHRDTFLSEGMTVRSLVRTVVSSAEYRSGATDEPGYVPKKLATPALLASQIEALTGFSWTRGGFDVLGSDLVGLQTLAGAPDGDTVSASNRSPNATLLLVQERLAQAASVYAVEHHRTDPDAPTLFTEVDFSETPDTDPDAMVAQIQALHLALFGTHVEADGDEVDANLGLWRELHAISGDPARSWAGVLSVLLRDPDFLTY